MDCTKKTSTSVIQKEILYCENKATYNVQRTSLTEALSVSLGAFTKLRKASVSFVMSVSLSVRLCLPVRMEQLGSHGRDFLEI
jgi:hypothetical protein